MEMEKVITEILRLNSLLEIFEAADDFHLRLENEPWLALVIERHWDEVCITHYIEQNGDLLRDPEMVFSRHEWSRLSGGQFQGWVPKSSEPGGLGIVYDTGLVKRVAGQPPQLCIHPRRLQASLDLAKLWANNLKSQGFVKRYAPGQISSVTHPKMLLKLA